MSKYLCLFSVSFIFTLWSAVKAKSSLKKFSFLFLFTFFSFFKISIRSALLARIRWSFCVLKRITIIIIIIIIIPWEFFTSAFGNGLSLNLSLLYSLLSIQPDLNNALVWMVSTRPLISKSSSPWINSLVTVLRAPLTIGIIVTFIFQFFSIALQGPGTYHSFHFLSILLYG